MPTTKAARDVSRDRKRLAVFCDGTWNDLRMPSLTNVARLAKCVEPRGWDGRRQVVFYDAGVGVATGVSRLADRLITVLGGAIGAGLDDKIESAYRFLVLNYDPGDEIFVFGFSRGAYTARSLCGLIRKCGIVRRDCFDKIPEAMKHYRDTAKRYDHPDLKAFRDQHTYRDPATGQAIATGEADMPKPADWAARAIDFQTPDAAPQEAPPARVRGAKETDAAFVWLPPDPPPLNVYRLMYLGVWDTVGSMGVPNTIPGLSRLVNRRYKFYDTNASDLLFSIRHACALDEDRKSFDITPVQNIHRLNRLWADARGKQVDHPDQADTYIEPSDRPYQQQWFPGTHGSVGGGNPQPGISSGALVWVAVGALRAGLKFDWSATSELGQAKDPKSDRGRNPMAPFRIKPDPKDPRKWRPMKPWEFDFIGFLTGYRDRVGPMPGTDPPQPKNPTSVEELNAMTLERVEADKTYRPATLKVFTGAVQRTPAHRVVARLVGVLIWLVLLALAWLLVRFGLG